MGQSVLGGVLERWKVVTLVQTRLQRFQHRFGTPMRCAQGMMPVGHVALPEWIGHPLTETQRALFDGKTTASTLGATAWRNLKNMLRHVGTAPDPDYGMLRSEGAHRTSLPEETDCAHFDTAPSK